MRPDFANLSERLCRVALHLHWPTIAVAAVMSAAQPSSPPPASGLIVFGASNPSPPRTYTLQRSRSHDLGRLSYGNDNPAGRMQWGADSVTRPEPGIAAAVASAISQQLEPDGTGANLIFGSKLHGILSDTLRCGCLSPEKPGSLAGLAVYVCATLQVHQDSNSRTGFVLPCIEKVSLGEHSCS